MYVERRIPQSEYISIHGLRYHVRVWGEENRPVLFMLHGWMDISASFQFIVDELRHDWRVIAPDWRGFGETEWSTRRGGAVAYHMLDLVADLDAIIQHFEPEKPVRLVGHSMGGNIACLYAGVRAKRVQRLVSLESIGSVFIDPARYPARFERWLENLRRPPELPMFETLFDVERHLQKGCVGLTDDRAAYLATRWSYEDPAGKRRLCADPWHKCREPGRYPAEEIASVWRSVEAPLLHIEAQPPGNIASKGKGADMDMLNRRLAMFHSHELKIIENSGHKVHLEQPARVAELIDSFCE